MRLVVAGSHVLEPGQVAMHLLQQLASCPIDTTVLLRAPLVGHPGPIEELTAQLAKDLAMEVEWCVPVPGEGREGTLFRNLRMVDSADRVLAYFHPEHVMSGGTGHVVETALNRDREVTAFVPEEDGPQWVGGAAPDLLASRANGPRVPAQAG